MARGEDNEKWWWERSGERNGTHHENYSWRDRDDPGVRHSEGYDVDDEGNVSKYHYAQKGQGDNEGTKLIFDFHTEQWEDESR